MSPESVLPAWVATYLVHSAVLLAAAALLAGRRLGLRQAWREAIWRTALLGGIVTATAQVAFSPSPWSIELPDRPAAVASIPAVTAGIVTPIAAPSAPVPERTTAAPGPAPALRTPVESPRSTPALARVLDVLLLVSVGFALLAGIRVVRARRTLRRSISGRRHLADGPWRKALDTLVSRSERRRTVRLAVVPRLGSPLARGVFRLEICVPERALEELSPEERDALLAHELAHVVRRDALRMTIGRTIETLLAVQPLNRLAGRRLREIAELRCDRLAEMRELGSALESLAEFPVIRTRIDRLDARWESLRNRAGAVRDMTEENE